MKTILILMDSLNRNYLAAYGNTWVTTPNLDRLLARSGVFDHNYCASMPCMPARRDLMTGRYSFLTTPWAPMEVFDDDGITRLRGAGVYTHLISDHYHYWELNGSGYHTLFDTWQFERGQEGDNEFGQVRDPEPPPFKGKNRRQDWINRDRMDRDDERQYPTPRCFDRAIEFLRHNRNADDWHLHLEVFDPHEPFCAPKRYRDLYADHWGRDYVFDWPPYAPLDESDDDEAIRHIRCQYAATLTMADTALGRLLDTLDELDAWNDTAVILTTDHGHLLGEHGFWAKNYMFVFEELAHTPLAIALPGSHRRGKRCAALTSLCDVLPTLLDLHGVNPPDHLDGRSLRPLLKHEQPHHDAVLFGYHGGDVHVTDGRHTYCRAPLPGSVCPTYTTMPVRFIRARKGQHDLLKQAECCTDLPQADGCPVFKIPTMSWQHHGNPSGHHVLYDLETDPAQEVPVDDPVTEARMVTLLHDRLTAARAPAEQFARLRLG